MDFARGNLERLRVRAPVAGKLTGLDLEIGQSLVGGERLGQIDDPTRFKVEAQIDEFYLDRVHDQQRARFRNGGREYAMHVTKVYPQVADGQFQADLIFDGEVPSGIRRGQTLQLQILLGTPERILLVRYGAFYQDTGGNWVFVVSDDGQSAVRRLVHFGRQNPRVVEVLSGLRVGERVITSPYKSFLDMDRLELGS
jgi:HlyD family secretion protein